MGGGRGGGRRGGGGSVSGCEMGAVLYQKLQGIIQEGLLDSLLPYLVQHKGAFKVRVKYHWTMLNKNLCNLFKARKKILKKYMVILFSSNQYFLSSLLKDAYQS